KDIMEFLAERLRIQLRNAGERHDVLGAAFAVGADDVIPRLLARTEAIAALLGTEDGANLLTGFRRAANILRIEDRKDGPHHGAPDDALLESSEERSLAHHLDNAWDAIETFLKDENFEGAMAELASLRAPLDAFFDRVTVNDPDPDLRRNRLRLLNRVRATMDRVADFSKIEG
ncbi:MAG: DALR anticodon-binding domain-containing protein, partial [Acetobacteraceae bacterium]